MNILAFDTCLDKMYIGGSVENKIIPSKIVETTKEHYHSAFLISTIKEFLKENGLKPNDVDVVATNIGPGSFTGIRACTTVARIFAQQLNKKAVGISSLEILSRINNQPSRLGGKCDSNSYQFIKPSPFEDECYLNSCQLMPPRPLRERAGVRGTVSENSGEGYKTVHRNYAPYIKEFARKMRKEATPQEIKLWSILRNNKLGFKFRRQFSINNKYIADFVCLEKRMIIEIDGGQHNGSFSDIERTFYLKNEDFRVIRFWNNEINENIEGCFEFLHNELNTPHPLPLSRKGRGELTLVALDARKETAYVAIYENEKEILAPQAILLEDLKEMIKNDDYFVITDDKLVDTLGGISYQQQDYDLGRFLTEIVQEKLNTGFDTDWQKLLPLYIQPPAVHK